MFKKTLYFILCAFSLASCIENDIPYPIVEAQILSMQVDGQCNAPGAQSADPIISKKERKVELFVDDRVDVSRLKVKSITTTDHASIQVDGCPQFPSAGFTSLDDLANPADAVLDFTKPVSMTLSIYQDYRWTVTVNQIVEREIDVTGQVGKAVVDADSRQVIVYVSKEQALNDIEVNVMDLGGVSGTVSPDPTSVTDFTSPVSFDVTPGWTDEVQKWTVFIYHASDDRPSSVSVFPMVTTAVLSGEVQSGKVPEVQYKRKKDSRWTSLKEVQVKGTSFEAGLKNLKPATEYEFRVNVDGKEGNPEKFTTFPAVALENGGFESWHLEKNKIWNPWDASGESYWDTGNDGATVVGQSNSIPTSDDTATGQGRAASLETKDMFGFLAAGNIFTGTYVKTEVPNGILSFGRKFTTFPTKLRIHLKYRSTVISHVKEPFENLKGIPDSCHIYIALTSWDEPLEIRTDPKKRQLFDKNAPEVIAYAEFIQGTTDEAWHAEDLVLNYRRLEVPKQMLIVATASKFGDYFTGGTGSKLLIDNFELIYD